MRRLFWIALGAAVGVLVVRKATQVLHKLTPSGMAEGVAGAGGRAQGALADFGSAVSMHAADREAELRSALGLDGVDGER
jgi:hypothetical protein